jgi:hypothetical protein
MGLLVMALLLLILAAMIQATFLQKLIICAIAGFLAACLVEWGKVFVTGADDALNKGYEHTAPANLPSRR